ncbi:hypothetical protein [Candidatus Halobonum tyrrellensis]|uniref:DUF8009 domain-containing protein n=1 Tax=Candidatus Halobonum tyrrellensis G22 TaxID=1324957 RepID=V4HH67_9EURY|nr:hypothetical protein [Candidatus Halobonum tyrrellensis]ESP87209.1 hypothetical protein K933_15129 [Candidatus Halobonum tyrrellensis G22]
MSDAGSPDPTVVRTLAVTTDDVVAALEARDRNRREAVLRVTPPFSPRMRARLHVAGGEGAYDDEGASPVHLHPRAFVPDEFPRFPGRGAERWRSAIRESLEKRVELDTPAGPHEVRVSFLG